MQKLLKKISQGTVLSLVILSALIMVSKKITIGEILLAETMPNYRLEVQKEILYKLVTSEKDSEKQEETAVSEEVINDLEVFNQSDIVGLSDVIYQEDTSTADVQEHHNTNNYTLENISELKNIDTLKTKFYIVDKETSLTEADKNLFDVEKFLDADLKIKGDLTQPKILIFHTHAYENYVGSDDDNLYDGVVGLGEELAEILRNDYGINVIHDTTRYDMADGKVQTMGAYERMEQNIPRILKENPSIEVAIDIHRDGIADESVKLVTKVDGKDTAQIMFFNGLSKLSKNGVSTLIDNLPNENQADNLAFSFNMQLQANEMFPGFTRKVYLKAYRYSLHMLPKSLLVEVGAQNNTKEEAFNAMRPLAKILAEVVL